MPSGGIVLGNEWPAELSLPGNWINLLGWPCSQLCKINEKKNPSHKDKLLSILPFKNPLFEALLYGESIWRPCLIVSSQEAAPYTFEIDYQKQIYLFKKLHLVLYKTYILLSYWIKIARAKYNVNNVKKEERNIKLQHSDQVKDIVSTASLSWLRNCTFAVSDWELGHT